MDIKIIVEKKFKIILCKNHLFRYCDRPWLARTPSLRSKKLAAQEGNGNDRAAVDRQDAGRGSVLIGREEG